ncbi:MAG TPA: hypothetical protein ENH82_19765 [bacterium]|nr:hypothetical protein [bacterium]
MNKGYDFDGVLTTGRFKPEPGDCIITGRTWKDAELTRIEMGAMGILNIPIYFMPPIMKVPTGENGLIMTGMWKAIIIDACELDEYFEDDEVQYRTIINNIQGETIITKV